MEKSYKELSLFLKSYIEIFKSTPYNMTMTNNEDMISSLSLDGLILLDKYLLITDYMNIILINKNVDILRWLVSSKKVRPEEIVSLIDLPEKFLRYIAKYSGKDAWKNISYFQRMSLKFISDFRKDINWIAFSFNIHYSDSEKIRIIQTYAPI